MMGTASMEKRMVGLGIGTMKRASTTSMAESSAMVTSIRVVFLPLNIKNPPFCMEEVDRGYIRQDPK